MTVPNIIAKIIARKFVAGGSLFVTLNGVVTEVAQGTNYKVLVKYLTSKPIQCMNYYESALEDKLGRTHYYWEYQKKSQIVTDYDFN